MMIKLFVAGLFLSFGVFIGTTPGLANTWSSSSSPRLDIKVIETCDNAECLIDLAIKEAATAKNRFEKNLISSDIATALYAAGNVDAAISYFETNLNAKNQNYILTHRALLFGRGELRLLGQDRSWWMEDNFPLPKEYVGRSILFDLRYAELMALQGDYSQALRAAEGIDDQEKRDLILFIIASIQLDQNASLEAVKTFGKMTKLPAGSAKLVLDLLRQASKQASLDHITSLASHKFKSMFAMAAGILALTDYSPGRLQRLLFDEIEEDGSREAVFKLMLNSSVKSGNEEHLKALFEMELGEKLDPEEYGEIFSLLLKDNRIDLAQNLASKAPDAEKATLAWGEIAAYTKDPDDFSRAFEFYERACCRANDNLKISMARFLTRAGFFRKAVELLNDKMTVKQRVQPRYDMYSDILNTKKLRSNTSEILDAVEYDYKHETLPRLKSDILKYGARLIDIDRSSTSILTRLSSIAGKKAVTKYLIPHYAYIGDFNTVHKYIASLTLTKERVRALTTLANFYSHSK